MNTLMEIGFDLSLIEPKTNGKVSARNLYKFLKLEQSQISRWFKTRIMNNDFAIENEDYCGFDMVVEGNKTQDFDLTPNFAKKLCMMAKSEPGERARNYFIKMEQKALNKELGSQIPSYQIDNPIERAEAWILEHKAHQLEVKQKDESILALATDVQATRETLAKNYKTVNARNKADLGNAINLLVNKHFNRNGDNYGKAHKQSWDAFYHTTGVRYYGANNSTYEQKLTFLNFLTTL